MPKLETTLTAGQLATARVLFDNTFVARFGGKNGTAVQNVPIPLADYPVASIVMLLEYGVQQKYTDRIGAADMSPADKRAKIESMIDAHLAGIVGRVARAGTDPLTTALRQVAMGQLSKEDVAAIKAMSDDAGDVALDAMIAVPENRDAMLATAEALVKAWADARAARAAAKTLPKLSLKGLGLATVAAEGDETDADDEDESDESAE